MNQINLQNVPLEDLTKFHQNLGTYIESKKRQEQITRCKQDFAKHGWCISSTTIDEIEVSPNCKQLLLQYHVDIKLHPLKGVISASGALEQPDWVDEIKMPDGYEYVYEYNSSDDIDLGEIENGVHLAIVKLRLYFVYQSPPLSGNSFTLLHSGPSDNPYVVNDVQYDQQIKCFVTSSGHSFFRTDVTYFIVPSSSQTCILS